MDSMNLPHLNIIHDMMYDMRLTRFQVKTAQFAYTWDQIQLTKKIHSTLYCYGHTYTRIKSKSFTLGTTT